MVHDLGGILSEILQQYPTPKELGDGPNARGTTIADFPNIHELITRDAEDAIEEELGDRADEYTIKGQMGQGSAAKIPYVAVLKNTETNSTQTGIYVVYLFDPVDKTLYLTLNQGATEAQRCSSRDGVRPQAVDILQNHAAMYREILEPPAAFEPVSAKLTEDLRQAKKYNAGAIWCTAYSISDLQNENQITSDLLDIVDQYRELLDTLYSEPKFDLDDSNFWKISPESGKYWPDWVAANVASISDLEEPNPNAPESNPTSQSHLFREEITEGDYVVAGAPIAKIPIVFGIGRVTADYETFQNQRADVPDVSNSEFDHTDLIGVDWVPIGEVSEQGGVSVNCRKEGDRLFEKSSIHPLNADFGDFIGATSRRMEAAELVNDAAEQIRVFTHDLELESSQIDPPRNKNAKFGTSTDEAVALYLSEREWKHRDSVARTTASVVRALAEELVAENRMGTEEITALYNVCQIPIKKSTLEDKIRNLDLNSDPTEEIISKLDEQMGIIGRGQFKVQVDPDNERDLLRFFSTILETSDKADLDAAIERLADRDPDNIEAGTISPFLYLLHPETYPVNNRPAREGMEAVFDFDVSSQLINYVAEVEKFAKVRDSYDFKSDYRDLDYFLETYQEYLCEKQKGYTNVEEATTDILDRMEESEYSNPLFGRVSLDTIEGWWNVLRGFQPNEYADPETADRLFEIEETLEELRPELEQIAQELNIPGLNALGPEETIFLAFLREYQRRLPIEEDEINANQAKLNALKRRAFHYFEHVDHPLVKHLREDECQVYVAPAPPDYWLSVLRNRLMAFSADHSETVTAIEPGDIILCYANQETTNTGIADYGGRLIGAGIVDTELRHVSGKEFTTLEAEPPEDPYNRFLTFEQLFTTAEIDKWDGTIGDLTVDQIKQSVEPLLQAGIPIGQINEECQRIANKHFIYQGPPSKLSDSGTYGRRETVIDMLAGSVVDVPSHSIFQDFNGRIPPTIFTDDLYFPDNRDIITAEKLAKQISSALRSGKHIIFTGPPGTGKTEVAERVAEHLATQHGYLYNDWKLTTATADWSTFNTVGGYMPSPEKNSDQLDFHPGVLLNRFKNMRTGISTNEPTVIDEINRADIDKAFGQLFTTLSGQTVTIPYVLEEYPEEEIQISIANDTELPICPHQFLVPSSWRLFGTMNTFDKTSLHELSYAFMRRFSFIRIGVPTIPDTEGELVELVEEFAGYWGIDDPDHTLLREVGQVWRQTNIAVEERSIGPAIVRDILIYVIEHDDSDEIRDRLTEAVISYIYPQLEGVPEREEIVRQIGNNTTVNKDEIDRAAKDMLGVSAFDSD